MNRGIALVLTPILAVATLAVAMQIGARRTVHAAVVYGAPKAHGATAFAWQILTLVEEDGTRSTEPVTRITVRARAKGLEASWRGDSNEDGVAEVRLDLPGVARGDAIDLTVTADGLEEPLAEGRVAWDDAAWMSGAPVPFVRPAKREGPIALDVAVLGEKLVARGFVPVMVRATSRLDGHPIENVAITAEPDPEVEVKDAQVTTCTQGWARIDAAARVYLGGMALHASVPDGRKGEWYAQLQVATGSIRPGVPLVAKGDDPELSVQSKSMVYAEVDDAEGRAFGAWAKLPSESGDRVVIHPGALPAGLKWLVTSSEPRGAEEPGEVTTTRPFLVAGATMPPGVPAADDTCAVEGYLAMHPAGGFHKFTALDGFVARKGANGARRRRGMTIGLTSLAVASVLELFLLVGAARSGRRLARQALEGIEPGTELVERSSAVSVVVGVVLALLGFALFAAILVARQ